MGTIRDPLTLVELRAKCPSLFYAQHWFDGEAFMRVLPNERAWIAPTRRVRVGRVPSSSKGLPLAVDLAHAYVNDPTNAIWDDYLWCRDVDAQGQRIYLGGCANGHGLELHRHLHITDRFAVPSWT